MIFKPLPTCRKSCHWSCFPGRTVFSVFHFQSMNYLKYVHTLFAIPPRIHGAKSPPIEHGFSLSDSFLPHRSRYRWQNASLEMTIKGVLAFLFPCPLRSLILGDTSGHVLRTLEKLHWRFTWWWKKATQKSQCETQASGQQVCKWAILETASLILVSLQRTVT